MEETNFDNECEKLIEYVYEYGPLLSEPMILRSQPNLIFMDVAYEITQNIYDQFSEIRSQISEDEWKKCRIIMSIKPPKIMALLDLRKKNQRYYVIFSEYVYDSKKP